MKVVADYDLCEANAVCMEQAPEVFKVDEEDNRDRATDDLFIHRVGTLPSCRRRRLASHLMGLSMRAGRAAGLDRAALDVDETSHTNATVVYDLACQGGQAVIDIPTTSEWGLFILLALLALTGVVALRRHG